MTEEDSRWTEQDILDQFFFPNRNKTQAGVILGAGDDCALLRVPPGEILVATTDTLVEDIHFLKGDDACHLGYKSVAVNLSDLAAMGAKPAWMLCNVTLPHADPTWLKYFSQGVFEALHQWDVALVGGDLTRGPLSITFTALGLLPEGQGVKRSGAQVGDYIAVTGVIGLAALAFQLQQKKVEWRHIPKEAFMRLHRPEPRVAVGVALRAMASSMIDITDGLTKDCIRLMQASGCGASIDLEQVPLPEYGIAHGEDLELLRHWISFGDDYELCFTLPSCYVNEKDHRCESPILKQIAEQTGVPISIIGRVNDTDHVSFMYQEKDIDVARLGHDHFKI